MAKEIVAMILAGGRGSRLYALTQKTAKPAVSFGGKYRIVDFPLSNCVNSDIDTVGIATQYQPQKLNEYIGNGQPWDLDRQNGGVHILSPYEAIGGAEWYKGTANAIFQNIGFVDMYDPEYVLILSGDHIYKMNYAKMLAHHKKAGADCTISVMEVPCREDAERRIRLARLRQSFLRRLAGGIRPLLRGKRACSRQRIRRRVRPLQGRTVGGSNGKRRRITKTIRLWRYERIPIPGRWTCSPKCAIC